MLIHVQIMVLRQHLQNSFESLRNNYLVSTRRACACAPAAMFAVGVVKLMMPAVCCIRPASKYNSVLLPAPDLPYTRPSLLAASCILMSVSNGASAPASHAKLR